MATPDFATEGPAYIDVNLAEEYGIAHTTPQCPAFKAARDRIVASPGPMSGIVWCPDCGDQEFQP